MDPSALIFVALAVAWGAYLIPKALEHSDGARGHTISTFSERVRVLARREAVSRRRSALMKPAEQKSGRPKAPSRAASTTPAPASTVAPENYSGESILETTQSGRLHLPTERPSVSRSAAAEAARRRRRVLGVLVFLFAAVAAMAAGQVISWYSLIAPALLIVGWLVLCRVMVTNERALRRGGAQPRRRTPKRRPRQQKRRPAQQRPLVTEASIEVESIAVVPVVAELEADDTTSIPVISETGVGQTWEPVNAPLPTYVSKTAVPRRSMTIDLDSTGVWTSGRSEADSAIAREADAARAQGFQGLPGSHGLPGSATERESIKRASGA